MYQIWLVITVFSLVAGVGLLLALLLLRGLSTQKRPPLEVVVGAFVAVGIAAFLGVYLRVLDIPRSATAYRVINSLSWAYVVFAALYFLGYWRKQPLRPPWLIPGICAVALGLVAFLLAHAPPGGGSLQVPERYRLFGVLALELVVSVPALLVGVVALRRAPELKSVPWRITQKGTGIALLILVPANALEFLGSLVLRLQGADAPDGFLFSVGYGLASVVLLVALVKGVRLRHASEPGPETVVPESMLHIVGITARERDIIERLLEGKTDRDIAELLFISPRTVDTHLRNVFRKCGVSSRLQLAQRVAEYRNRVGGES